MQLPKIFLEIDVWFFFFCFFLDIKFQQNEIVFKNSMCTFRIFPLNIDLSVCFLTSFTIYKETRKSIFNFCILYQKYQPSDGKAKNRNMDGQLGLY